MKRQMNFNSIFPSRRSWPERAALCLTAVILLSFCALTAALQWKLFRPADLPPLPVVVERFLPDEPLEAELREYLERRSSNAQKKIATVSEEPGGSQDAYLNPPDLFVKGIVVSGGKKYAILSMGDSGQSFVVKVGEKVEGDVKVLEINPRGLVLSWRNRTFFVALE